MTGMLIDFEFQEGEKIMGHFECVGDYNKSTSWLLRLTSRWHTEEKRTVLMVDQNVISGTDVADYIYVLELGANKLEGTKKTFDEEYREAISEWLF